MFVHRNVGNLVLGNDLNALSGKNATLVARYYLVVMKYFVSVLEYAVAHLDVKDILVVGHYDCGACKSAVRYRS